MAAQKGGSACEQQAGMGKFFVCTHSLFIGLLDRGGHGWEQGALMYENL